MKYVLYGLCAVLAYLLSSFNPAIALSRAVYHTEIRTQGSGNPGFTNFRRVFGARYAWVVSFWILARAGGYAGDGGAAADDQVHVPLHHGGADRGRRLCGGTGGGTAVCVAYAACVAFVVVRHRENIRRLLHGNETKFRFGHS